MPRPKRTKSAIQLASALTLCVAVGCSGTQSATRTPSKGKAPSPDTAEAQDDGLASLIAEVPTGTLGPYVCYGRDGIMTLYAPPAKESEDDARTWMSQRLDGEGRPQGAALNLGTAPADVPFAVVRETQEGYVALWVRQVHQAEVLEGMLLHQDGSMASEVTTMTQAQGEVVWAEAFGTPKGTLVLWAEQSGDRATVQRIMLDEEGAVKGNGDVIARDVRAWEAVRVDEGVALALVVANEQNPMLGSVVLLRVGEDGKPLGEPVSVSKGATAQIDVGLVRTGRSLLMAWTDRSNADSLVHAAATDMKGRLMVAARAPLPPQGDQALVALIAPSPSAPNQALLVYEELPSKGHESRQLHLSTLSAEAVASDQSVSLSFASVGRPLADFSPTPDGFLLLTRAPVCADDGSCGERRVPWFVRLGSDLSVRGASPLLVDALDRQPPTVVWSPGCTTSSCLALAAGSDDPAPVVAARLPKGPVAKGAPLHTVPPLDLPRPLTNRAVHMTADPLSDLDAVRVGQTTFVGWITHFVEGLGGPPRKPPPSAPGDPSKPVAAQLAVQRLDASGQPIEEPTLVSVRAMSAGGVALSPLDGQQEIAAAWVARDNGNPQLFVTRIGDDGKRKLQRMITRAKGDAADTAIVAYDGGWIVAWVDWRDGNGEVYATRLNRMLVRLTPERRLTDAPGDASDVSLLVRGKEVFVAYGDPRDHPNHAMANPYVQKLDASSLKRVGDERRIATTDLHAKGLQLSGAGGEVVVGWVARAAEEQKPDREGARMTQLDPETLRPRGQVSDLRTRGGAGAPVSLRMTCKPRVCRGAAMIEGDGGMLLQGFSWFPDRAQIQQSRLGRTSGPAAADVAPAVLGDDVFFVDRGVDGDNRVRRVRVQWEE